MKILKLLKIKQKTESNMKGQNNNFETLTVNMKTASNMKSQRKNFEK